MNKNGKWNDLLKKNESHDFFIAFFLYITLLFRANSKENIVKNIIKEYFFILKLFIINKMCDCFKWAYFFDDIFAVEVKKNSTFAEVNYPLIDAKIKRTSSENYY